MLVNEQNYINEEYFQNSIKKYSRSIVKPIASYKRDIENYSLEEQKLESEEELLGDGIRVESKQFYKLIQMSTRNDVFDPTSFGGFQIQMSLNVV